MGTVVPGSLSISTTDRQTGTVDSPEELDAGALFVLKSKGKHTMKLKF